ncbi:acetyl-CoA synthetase-like protein [Lentinus tigrinus ALCF2SS1-7]|uniref:Acetyl-CoA synthetase-like protein n=1 Tax=Lentinus tigrinus ALCF2SS1-6 TaxID=1328759 RepID=A0A5C2RZ28_9APHY|nr:acetyl-CoA synthetase-like protein [Lentinus tigrinus ALCF2SS1-6]RPD71040.1 acetyl-CoA synthetase-like protein [Lentinus tigrinus ALCF2SS1-7]
MSTTFSPPPFPPVVPIPEYLLRVASTHPDREVVCFLQDGASEEEATTTSITWRQFLADVWDRVDYLVEVTGLEPRTLGKDRVVVGLLAESNYAFLMDLVAMFILRWQVLLISIRNSPDAIHHLMHSTGCSAVLVDSTISHLHVDILRKDPVTGVAPTVVLRPPVSSDVTRDGIERALSFLEQSACLPPADLRKEAEGGAFFLHTSGSTGESQYSAEFGLATSAGNCLLERSGRHYQCP